MQEMNLTTENLNARIVPTGEATAILPGNAGQGPPMTIIGTQPIRDGFDAMCLRQAMNSRYAPGVTQLVLNPDGHAGYGAPIGCVMASPTHIYPGPVGVDIKCSMSLLQFDLPAGQIASRSVRRALIEAICERIPTGPGQGQRSVRKSRRIDPAVAREALIQGASPQVCQGMGIPESWALRCEDSAHVAHDGTNEALGTRLDKLLAGNTFRNFDEKLAQLGSYGGGNHFGECEAVQLIDDARARETAEVFGLRDNCVAFLSHCGSRGFGNILAQSQFQVLKAFFNQWSIPFPAGDTHLVYAPLGSAEANDYLDDMALGANFATLNHLLINALVLEAFQEVIPGVTGQLVYFISHNIARREVVDNQLAWVHRKGATRAFPAGHHALKGTPFEQTGHPILLPGNPRDGSVVMVAESGADKSCYSVNHGAGRRMGRKDAMRRLDQASVDRDMTECDILTNCRTYPKDEAPDAYKDFGEVLRSVELAGLAHTVTRLKARFVLKDGSTPDD
jgi:tRNA-splicing ligase RtcB